MSRNRLFEHRSQSRSAGVGADNVRGNKNKLLQLAEKQLQADVMHQ